MIEEAIKKYYGERCPDYDADCVVCQAWEQFEVKWGKVTQALNAAYLAGFNASCEGHNGEYPFDDKGINPADDPAWCTRRDRNLAKINETQTI